MDEQIGFYIPCEVALELDPSVYVGDPCPYCGKPMTRIDLADAIVSDVDKRPAHRQCWNEHDDALLFAKARLNELNAGMSAQSSIARTSLVQAAASIAIAEELRELNAILHNATDLNGAVKLSPDSELLERMDAQTAQAKRIENALNSIARVIFR